jgi:hypothetical protein
MGILTTSIILKNECSARLGKFACNLHTNVINNASPVLQLAYYMPHSNPWAPLQLLVQPDFDPEQRAMHSSPSKAVVNQQVPFELPYNHFQKLLMTVLMR